MVVDCKQSLKLSRNETKWIFPKNLARMCSDMNQQTWWHYHYFFHFWMLILSRSQQESWKFFFQRQSYTIKELLILAKYEQGESGKGLLAIAKKYASSRNTILGWVKKCSELEVALERLRYWITLYSSITRRGLQVIVGPQEDRLYEWIRDKNKKGLKVKNTYIMAKAHSLHQIMIGFVGEDELLVVPTVFHPSALTLI